MSSKPVETTLYSLSHVPPSLDGVADRRDGERHMTLYRVGSILIDGRRELCLIKNISAGGMMIRLYCSAAEGTPLTVELKSGQPIRGQISWIKGDTAGVSFDGPVDVIDILSASMNGPRPRMPRIETDCFATLRDGANVLRARVRDISQGGTKIECNTVFSQGTELVVSLPGLEPQRGVACWSDHGLVGIGFNRLLPLGDLVAWLHSQRELQRGAA